MVDWIDDYEEMEEDFDIKERRVPKRKPKKSWKQIEESNRKSTNKKQWQKKRRKSKDESNNK